MPANTTKYVIPYPLAADPVASEATAVQNLANRVDLLLGESGQATFNGAAATNIAVNITLARTYPGNNGAAVPGIVVLQHTALVVSGTTLNMWVSTWLGSASTITGFTITITSSATVTSRLINWRFLPVL